MKKNRIMMAGVYVCALLLVAMGAVMVGVTVNKMKGDTVTLELPAPEDVSITYYIPDMERPYEQVWIGGESAAKALERLEGVRFRAVEEEPKELTECTGAWVIYSSKEAWQIVVRYKEDEMACVYSEGKWLVSERRKNEVESD